MKFIITVDTEADNQWKKPGTQTLKNLEYLPGFQELCARYGFTPTYLVTYEVANNLSIASVLKTWHTTGVAEVGAHLHPWTTPPLSEEDYQGVQTFPHELATDVLEQKLLALTEKITAMLGERPTSFRAGRWGLGEHMVPLLVRLGYTVDSSVTPYINWKGFKGKENGTGGPDFRGAPLKPYVVSAQDVRTVGSSGLLEVPMTIVRTGFFRLVPHLSGNDICRSAADIRCCKKKKTTLYPIYDPFIRAHGWWKSVCQNTGTTKPPHSGT